MAHAVTSPPVAPASLRVLALEPFYGGSHRAFLDGWIARSRHRFDLLALPARNWKWRMRHAAVTFAGDLAQRVAQGQRWDVVLASDMLGLAEFRSLAPREVARLRAVLYLHENQWTTRSANRGSVTCTSPARSGRPPFPPTPSGPTPRSTATTACGPSATTCGVVEPILAGAYPLLPARLSYPELLSSAPERSTAEFFYPGPAPTLASALARLAERLVRGDLWGGDTDRARRLVARFCWSRRAPALDRGLAEVGLTFPA